MIEMNRELKEIKLVIIELLHSFVLKRKTRINTKIYIVRIITKKHNQNKLKFVIIVT